MTTIKSAISTSWEFAKSNPRTVAVNGCIIAFVLMLPVGGFHAYIKTIEEARLIEGDVRTAFDAQTSDLEHRAADVLARLQGIAEAAKPDLYACVHGGLTARWSYSSSDWVPITDQDGNAFPCSLDTQDRKDVEDVKPVTAGKARAVVQQFGMYTCYDGVLLKKMTTISNDGWSITSHTPMLTDDGDEIYCTGTTWGRR